MCELREIAGRADGSLAWDHRKQVSTEQLEKSPRQLRADPGVTGRERPRAKEKQAADDIVGQRLANRRRVRADKRELHGLEVGTADVRVSEGPEAGRDAVHDLALVYGIDDHRPAALHPLLNLWVELGSSAATGHRDEIFDSEGVAVDGHNSHRGNLAGNVHAGSADLYPVVRPPLRSSRVSE
jgi:hypothetical protein